MPEDDALTIVDLFSGCGGMTRGFVDAGFRPVFAVDFDLASAGTYSANFPTAKVIAGDIAEVPDEIVPKARVVIGGPPCQGFSGLGKRDPEDHRNGLWKQYKRLVHLVDPDAFVIENVARFLKSPEFDDLQEELTTGTLKDYKFVSGILHAEDFGVPQRRHRAFLIASRLAVPTWPERTHSRDPEGDCLPWVTVQDAFRSLVADPPSNVLPARRMLLDDDEYIPGPFDESEIHVGRTYQARSLERYDVVPAGGNRFDLPADLQFDCWRKKKTGTTDVLGRMRWNHPSLTIRTEFFKPEKGCYLHPRYEKSDELGRANRAISHAEAARLQSFDDRHVWCGSKVAIARQIGNAVPPKLAKQIAIQAVIPLLRQDTTSQSAQEAADVQLRLQEGVAQEPVAAFGAWVPGLA